MRIVSNTTPISELYKINELDLLRSLYGTIYIHSCRRRADADRRSAEGEVASYAGWFRLTRVHPAEPIPGSALRGLVPPYAGYHNVWYA